MCTVQSSSQPTILSVFPACPPQHPTVITNHRFFQSFLHPHKSSLAWPSCPINSFNVSCILAICALWLLSILSCIPHILANRTIQPSSQLIKPFNIFCILAVSAVHHQNPNNPFFKKSFTIIVLFCYRATLIDQTSTPRHHIICISMITIVHNYILVFLYILVADESNQTCDSNVSHVVVV